MKFEYDDHTSNIVSFIGNNGLKILVQYRVDPKNFWGQPMTKIQDTFMAVVDLVYYFLQDYPAVSFNDDSYIHDAETAGRTEIGSYVHILKNNQLWVLDGYTSVKRLDEYKIVDQILSTFKLTN